MAMTLFTAKGRTGRPDIDEVDKVARALATGARDAGGHMLIARDLTKVEQQMIHKRRQALAAQLAPMTRPDLAELVANMMLGFDKGMVSEEEAESTTVQFVNVLGDLPAFALEDAVRRFCSGEVSASEVGLKQIDPRRPPTTAMVRIIAQRIAKVWLDLLHDCEMLLVAKVAEPIDEMSPEERAAAEARVRESAEAYKREAAERHLESVLKEASNRPAGYFERRERDRRIAEYEARGLEPAYADDGMVLSLSFLLANGARIECRDDGNELILPAGVRR